MTWYRFILSFMLLSLIILPFAAQETVTPAPSKTPEPSEAPLIIPTLLNATTATPVVNNPLPRAFTQEDLTVLVGNVQRPNGIVWLDDKLYTACNGDWTLYEINARTGATTTFIYGIQNAHTLFAEETEAGFNLWIPDFDRNRLMRLDHRRSSPVEITADNLDGAWGIDALDAENFLISNVRANNLIQVSREGESRIVMTDLRSPAGVVVDGEYVYLANNGSSRRAIEWFETAQLPTLGEVSSEGVAQPLVRGLQNTSSLVLAADGYLYFTYALGTRGVVGRVNPEVCREGGCTNDQVQIVVFTELQAPLAGLTISPDMRLFIHTIFRPEIYWVQLPKPSS